MDRNTFEMRLRTAAQRAVRFASTFVQQRLPEDFAFSVYPNQSYDGNPLVDDETTYPEESLAGGLNHGPWTTDRVVGFLWRDGKVPEWIDTSVESVEAGQSLVALHCCGRFTAQEELLYYRSLAEVPPFVIKSPAFPPLWESVEASDKFDLYWRKRRSWRGWYSHMKVALARLLAGQRSATVKRG